MADARGRRVHKITCRPQVVAAAALDSSGQPEVGPAASQPRPQWYTEQNCLVWTEVHKKATKPVPWAEGPGLSHRQPGGPAHRLLEGSAPNPGAPACRALALTADCGPPWSGVHAAHVAGVRHVAAASSPPPPCPPCSFLCAISPAKSHDLGIWGPQEKDTVCAQPLHQSIN